MDSLRFSMVPISAESLVPPAPQRAGTLKISEGARERMKELGKLLSLSPSEPTAAVSQQMRQLEVKDEKSVVLPKPLAAGFKKSRETSNGDEMCTPPTPNWRNGSNAVYNRALNAWVNGENGEVIKRRRVDGEEVYTR